MNPCGFEVLVSGIAAIALWELGRAIRVRFRAHRDLALPKYADVLEAVSRLEDKVRSR